MGNAAATTQGQTCPGPNSDAATTQREKLPAHWPSHELEHADDNSWAQGQERFLCIVDSQIIKREICGHAAMTTEKYRPLFQRVMQRLVGFIEAGLMPPTDFADPAQWRPREFNARADYLCNKALDNRSSLDFVEEDLEVYRVEGVQWECFSDGGCRGDGWSSFAWVVDAVWPISGQRHRFTVAFGYEIVEGNHSSFQTELWGLERAVLTLAKIRS